MSSRVRREEHPFIDEQGKESVNFQITMIGAIIVCVGLFLMPLIGIFDVALTIIGGVKAANGERWRYPLTIRFIT